MNGLGLLIALPFLGVAFNGIRLELHSMLDRRNHPTGDPGKSAPQSQPTRLDRAA